MFLTLNGNCNTRFDTLVAYLPSIREQMRTCFLGSAKIDSGVFPNVEKEKVN